MKISAFILFVLISLQAHAQSPVFQPLISPNLHAGCYMGEDTDEVIANLSEEDDEGNPLALFNLDGKDETFQYNKGSGKYPDVYENGDYKIFIRQKFIEKVPDTCLEIHRYKVKLVYKGRKYRYRFDGFCGC